MTSNHIADILLVTAPWIWAFKAILALILGITLTMQHAQSRLGLWINILFFSIFGTGVCGALLMLYIKTITDGMHIDSTPEWALLVGMNVTPLIVVIAGIMVTYYTYWSEPIETRDQQQVRREVSQSAREADQNREAARLDERERSER